MARVGEVTHLGRYEEITAREVKSILVKMENGNKRRGTPKKASAIKVTPPNEATSTFKTEGGSRISFINGNSKWYNNVYS